MASYTKQMIEAAQPWLKANPDPSDTTLRVPRSTQDLSNMDKLERLLNQAALSGRQDLIDRVTEINAAAGDYCARTRELSKVEDELETLINEGRTPAHDKHAVDMYLHTDRGQWFLSWGRNGYNVFDLSPDFVAAMLLTDSREIDIAETRLPFPGLLMLIPDGFAGNYTKIHLDEWFTKLRIYASNGTHGLDSLVDRDGLTWDDIPDYVDEEVDRHVRDTIRQIVFCTLAYVGAVQSAVEPRDAQRRRGPAKERTPKVWDIGRTIRIDPQLVRSVRAGAREVAFRIKHRHIVRGHYRNQPIGPGRQERKRIWIAPFWKGPSDGAALVHTYKLDTP